MGRARAVALGAVLVAAGCVKADQVPPSPKWCVTNASHFMSSSAWRVLTYELAAYNERTGHQLIVWIATELPKDADVEAYCTKLFNAWALGRKDVDDGLALFVFARDHQYRLRVGYGLLKAIPDRVAVQIGREVITPQLRAGRRDEAIRDAMHEIMRLIDSAG